MSGEEGKELTYWPKWSIILCPGDIDVEVSCC
jgi:hypothetical protein